MSDISWYELIFFIGDGIIVRYMGTVIPVVIVDVKFYQSMEEDINEGLCSVDGGVGW